MDELQRKANEDVRRYAESLQAMGRNIASELGLPIEELMAQFGLTADGRLMDAHDTGATGTVETMDLANLNRTQLDELERSLTKERAARMAAGMDHVDGDDWQKARSVQESEARYPAPSPALSDLAWAYERGYQNGYARGRESVTGNAMGRRRE